ncbi:MAG TPA: tetratricopeptide repeat protein [Phycisphaerae bacterium]|nr:tetratricopeptide repeat protein [Phycisphaerae bacterium]
MTRENDIRQRLDRLGRTLADGPSVADEVMRRIADTPAEPPRTTRRLITMIHRHRNPIAAGVVMAACVVAAVTWTVLSTAPAYALTDTVKALESVRHLHVLRYDKADKLADERWIEVGADGFQTRYRQDTPPDFLVIDDGKTCMAWHKDRNTVVLYRRYQQQYQWVGNLGQFFKELAGPGVASIERNVDYKGRRAHHVRWLKLNMDCYVDADTKLPIAVGGYEVRYDEPPAGTFKVDVPKGVQVVDMTKGVPADLPAWLASGKEAGNLFGQALQALADGDYRQGAELLERVVKLQPGRNWAQYWLGAAWYHLGRYDDAEKQFTVVLGMLQNDYCHLARGLARAKAGNQAGARQDIDKALDSMVMALRHPEAAVMFDYAYDPLYRSGRRPAQGVSLQRMIARLRAVTGKNFGFDPDKTPPENEAAIAAWEKWLKTTGPAERARLDPAANLRLLIAPPPAEIRRVTERIAELPWTGVGKDVLGVFEEAKKVKLAEARPWLVLSLKLYDARLYEQAMEGFRRTEELTNPGSLLHVTALTWQGHLHDLAGRRAEAVKLYRRALAGATCDSMRHDQYGIVINREWLEQRLQEPFQRK